MTEAEELELLELEAEAAGAKQPATKKMGAGQAALKGIQDLPTAGFGDELGGALQSGLMALSNAVPAAGRLLAGPGFRPQQVDAGDTYGDGRDQNRAESKKAQEDQPGAYYGAGTALAVPLAIATPGFQAAKGAGLLARMGAGAATGATQGAVAGIGHSEARSAAGLVRDAALGAGAGGLVGGTLPAAGAGLRRAAKALPGKLEHIGINQGRRVLLNGADSLSSRAPTSDEAVAEAIRSRGIRPFETTQKAFERLQSLTDEQGEAYNRIVSELEAKGVKGPDAQRLADELIRRGAALERHTMNETLPAEYLTQAQRVAGKAAPEPRLGLTQAENLKRSLQKQAKYGRVEETPLNEVRRDIASAMRQANEDAIEEAAKSAGASPEVRATAERFVPTKQRLGRLIEATNAAGRGAARAAQRREFSLTDNMFAAAGLASGGAGGLVQGLAQGAGNNLLRNRGTSALAVGALRSADALRRAAQAPVARGARPVVSPEVQAFLEALRARGMGEPALTEDEDRQRQRMMAEALLSR